MRTPEHHRPYALALPRPAFALMLVTSAFAVGCGSVRDDRIDTICGCEGCGDREREEVTIHVDADWDTSTAYACENVLEPYWLCQLDEFECSGGEYKDDNERCSKELDQYRECLVAQSTRTGEPY